MAYSHSSPVHFFFWIGLRATLQRPYDLIGDPSPQVVQMKLDPSPWIVSAFAVC
jgi:hypothetical protein